MFKDYYAILGIEFPSDAAEIKDAYKEQTLKWHPDLNKGRDTTKEMVDINEAYSILSNPFSKAKYDNEYLSFRQKQGTFQDGSQGTEKDSSTTSHWDHSTGWYTYDYDVQDDSLKQDIYNARKAAEKYVSELIKELKETTKTAAKAALKAVRPWLYMLLGGFIISLVISLCNLACEGPSLSTNGSSYLTSLQTESKLKEMVRQANQMCPMSLGMLGETNSIRLEGNNVVMSGTIDENFVKVETLSKVDPEMLKRNFLTVYRSSTNSGFREILKVLIEEDAGFTIKYKGNVTGKILAIYFSPEELASVNTDGELDAEAPLMATIEMTNVQCPVEIDDGILMTKMALEGDYIVYYALVDEDKLSVAEIEAEKKEYKDYVLQYLSLPDFSVRKLVQLFNNANKGVKYKYTGETSHRECIITITASELQSLR